MMYAVAELNKELGEGTLGLRVVDDCYAIDRAMEASIEFMMGEGVQERRQWIEQYKQLRAPDMKSPMLAVVGAANSDMSSAVASLLSVNMIPQISYSATSQELSDKTRYPSFLRTIPPDNTQVAAMADLIKYFNWTWIAAVAIDNSYGRFGLEGLKELLYSVDVCVAKEILVDPNDIAASLPLLTRPPLVTRAEVIVLFWPGVSVESFFKEVLKANITGKTWIASESWGAWTFSAEEGLGRVLRGSLGLSPFSSLSNHSFFDYVQHNLSFDHANPWFQEYMNSKLPSTDSKWSSQSTQLISEHPAWNISHLGNSNWFAQVPQVIDAVFAIGAALKPLLIHKQSITPLKLLESLHTTAFQTFSHNSMARFDRHGDLAGGSYSINNLVEGVMVEGLGEGNLRFIDVGLWNGTGYNEESPLSFVSQISRLEIPEPEGIVWSGHSSIVPISCCHAECEPGTYKIFDGRRCCWKCGTCPRGAFSNQSGAQSCLSCPQTMTNNSANTACVFDEQYIQWTSAGELVVLSLAGLGGVVVLVVLGVLWRWRRTPVVVCSNAPLTFLLLLLLLLAFLLPFLFALRPSTLLCGAEALLLGFVFSTITAIFLVKTRHVWKIFTAKLSDTLYMVNQRGLQRRELWHTGGFALISLGLAIPYLLTNPPEPVPHVADCGNEWRMLQIINVSYIALLSLATTYIAFRARRLPENYNEANSISTTMLILILVWLSSLPSYFRVSLQQRTLILSLAVDAAAFFILIIMFGPKVYIIYFEPEKNTLLYVSRTNMIHIWKQHSRQERKKRHKSELEAQGRKFSILPAFKRSKTVPQLNPTPSEELADIHESPIIPRNTPTSLLCNHNINNHNSNNERQETHVNYGRTESMGSRNCDSNSNNNNNNNNSNNNPPEISEHELSEVSLELDSNLRRSCSNNTSDNEVFHSDNSPSTDERPSVVSFSQPIIDEHA